MIRADSCEAYDRLTAAIVAVNNLLKDRPASVAGLEGILGSVLDIAEEVNAGGQLFPPTQSLTPGQRIEYFPLTDAMMDASSRLFSTLDHLSNVREQLLVRSS